MLGGVGYDLVNEKEEWMQVVLRKFSYAFTDKVFVDVGVNVGQTLLKVFSLNNKQHYIGFEPNASCLHYLYQLMEKNNFSTVTIMPVALADKTEMLNLQLYYNDATDSSASIVEGFRPQQIASVRKVPAIGKDDLQFDSSVGMIKIDVEGAELNVIKSLEAIVAKDRPLILCEILPVYSIENTFRLDRQKQIEEILKQNSFGMARITPSGGGEFVSEIGVHSDIERSNYIFYPLERLNEVKQKLNS